MLLQQDEMANDSRMPPELREMLASVRTQTLRIADVLRQLASLKQPRSIEPLRGLRMLDLSGDGHASIS
jgi:hypothetical protein